jgi:porin
MATSGFSGPSTFPVTTLGVRAKTQISETVYLQHALMDGKPGPLESFRAEQFRLAPGYEGYFHIHEMGHATEDADAVGVRKFAGGLWSHTFKQDSIDPDYPDQKDNPWGGYLLGEYGFSKHLGITARYGFSNGAVQAIDRNIAASVVAKGLCGDLDHDRWGLGFTQAQFSPAAGNDNTINGIESGVSETAIEATISWRLFNGFYIQPDVQYVLNPSGLTQVTDPMVGYLRVEINF